MKKIALLTLVTVAAGCSQSTPKAQPPPPPGVVKTFTAAPTALTAPGDKTTLTWTTQDATTVTLEQLGVGPITIPGANGSVDVTLSIDATFLLTARGPGGTDSAAVGVKVGMAQGGVLFNAVPQAITSGQGVTLVWNAPGATVTIADGTGAMVDLQGQTDHGSVRVTPARDATYTLTAGSVTKTVDISVAPVIFAFTSAGSPNPGEMVNLSWKTGGGSQVVLTRDGVGAPLSTVTDPAMVDVGGFSETAPATLPADGVLHYTLTLTGSSGTVTKDLDVRINGSVSIDQFTVPAYARSPGQYTVQWKTSGATSLELQRDGVTFYVSPDQATTDSFQMSLPSPAASETLTLIARNDRAEASKNASVEAVGTPTVVSFTSDKNGVNTGGDPVVLSWNVTNARNVRINEVGGPVVTATSGHVDTGSVTVYPNRPSVTYHLVADNGAGDAIMPQELTVTVTTLATLTFDSVVPTGALTNVTGSTVPNAVSMSGLPNAVKNAMGEAFVDISQTGQALDHGFDTAAYVNTLPGLFYTRLYGHRVYLDRISIAVNGWFFFSTTSVDGPNTNTATFGTALEPLAIAPYWRDLTFNASTANAFAQLDDVAGTQRLIVQWQDMELGSDENTKLTFQAQIYGDGKVVFAYQTLDGVPTTGGATIGVVNGAETDAVMAPDQPVAGDTYTFFTTKALPAPIRVEPTPYVASVAVSGGGSIEVEGDARLLPGQFAITEVNPNPPAAVTNGEWIEVTSFGTQLVNLQGWTLDFGGGNTHQIAQSVPLAPGTRVVLAQAADLGEPDAGITATYVYPSTFAMPNTTGTVALALGGAPYSSVTWDTTMTGDAGIAVRADPGDTNIIYSGTNLQLACSGAGSPAYGDNGQYGTPGATQGRCFPYVLTAGMPNRFLPIGGSGTPIILGDAGTSATDDKVYAITLPTPVNVHGKQVTQLYVGTNGWITATSTTSSVASNRSTPSTSAPNGSIAPFWDDLVGTLNPGSGMYWQQFDPDMTPATGDEFTIISWEQWKTYFGTTQINFQVKLGPHSAIEYDFGNMSDAGTQEDQGISATTWLEHPSGKAAMKINVNSATAPGIQPHTGFVYTYTP
ncbi:MAG: lamin tail domain-containing protein [Myxococcaceae bacterium]